MGVGPRICPLCRNICATLNKPVKIRAQALLLRKDEAFVVEGWVCHPPSFWPGDLWRGVVLSGIEFIPALLVIFASIAVGIPCIILVWTNTMDESAVPLGKREVISACALTAAIIISLMGAVGCFAIPFPLSERGYFGISFSTGIPLGTVGVEFILLVMARMFVSANDGENSRFIISWLNILLGIVSMGIIGLVGCMPQAPWNIG